MLQLLPKIAGGSVGASASIPALTRPMPCPSLHVDNHLFATPTDILFYLLINRW